MDKGKATRYSIARISLLVLASALVLTLGIGLSTAPSVQANPASADNNTSGNVAQSTNDPPTTNSFSPGYRTTVNISPTDTIQRRLTRTENGRAVEYVGSSTYIYDVSAVDYRDHSNKQLSKLQVKFRVTPNPLTRVLWQENYQVFNENYFYNGDNITKAEFDNLRQELSSIPVVTHHGDVGSHSRALWNLNKPWKGLNPKNITMNIFLNGGVARGKFGNHSISWTVTSQTDWKGAESVSENTAIDNGRLKINETLVRENYRENITELDGTKGLDWSPFNSDYFVATARSGDRANVYKYDPSTKSITLENYAGANASLGVQWNPKDDDVFAVNRWVNADYRLSVFKFDFSTDALTAVADSGGSHIPRGWTGTPERPRTSSSPEPTRSTTRWTCLGSTMSLRRFPWKTPTR